MPRKNSLVALLLLSAIIGGCARPDMSAYPTLARRPVEQRVNVAPSTVETAPVPEPVSATLAEAIRALGRDADTADAAFRAEVEASRPHIASGRGAAEGSESWAAANMALSRLEALRGPALFALAELDRLAMDEAQAGREGGVALIEAEQARVAALIEAQMAVMRPFLDTL